MIADSHVAAQKPADILFLVSAAFSFAAAAFFPALVLGIFWKRANRWGASLGMMAGLGVTFYYMATTQPWMRSVFGVTRMLAARVICPTGTKSLSTSYLTLFSSGLASTGPKLPSRKV